MPLFTLGVVNISDFLFKLGNLFFEWGQNCSEIGFALVGKYFGLFCKDLVGEILKLSVQLLLGFIQILQALIRAADFFFQLRRQFRVLPLQFGTLLDKSIHFRIILLEFNFETFQSRVTTGKTFSERCQITGKFLPPSESC